MWISTASSKHRRADNESGQLQWYGDPGNVDTTSNIQTIFANRVLQCPASSPENGLNLENAGTRDCHFYSSFPVMFPFAHQVYNSGQELGSQGSIKTEIDGRTQSYLH